MILGGIHGGDGIKISSNMAAIEYVCHVVSNAISLLASLLVSYSHMNDDDMAVLCNTLFSDSNFA